MPINNTSELEAVVNDVDRGLQEIQDYLGDKNNEKGKVRFPRGFIGTASGYRNQLPAGISDPVKSNISYTLMMVDVLRWIAVRTDLAATAISMVYKTVVVLIGGLCDCLTGEALRGQEGADASFKTRTRNLLGNDVIDEELKNELDWVWDTRNNQHLTKHKCLEHDMYEKSDCNRAMKAYKSLRDQMKKSPE